MNCEYFETLISARLDGELSDQEEAALSSHLANCEECSRLLEDFHEQKALHTARFPVPMPEELEKGILNKTSGASRKFGSLIDLVTGNYIVPKPLAWGAAAVILALLLTAIFQPLKTMTESGIHETVSKKSVRIQKVVFTDNDIIETRKIASNNNL